MGIEENNNNVRFSESFNVISFDDSPLRKSQEPGKSFVFSYYKEAKINPEDLFQLKLKVKNVGVFLIAFDLNKLDRETLIDRVFLLRKIHVNDKTTALRKIDKLKDVIIEFKPVFVAFGNPDTFAPSIEEAKEIYDGIKFFYVEGDESCIKEEKVNPEEKTVEIKEETKPSEPVPSNKFVAYLQESKKLFKKDIFNFIFTIVAAFLIGFTVGIGIFNAYLGKNIYIFFFISTLVGMTLLSFVCRDTIVDYKFKSLHMVLNGIITFIGMVLSIGGYYLFVHFAKEPGKPLPNALLIIAIQIVCMSSALGIAFLIKKFAKKTKKKTEASK